MKNQSLKRAVAGIVVASICLASTVVMAKQGTESVEVNYNDLQVTIKNKPVNTIVSAEPFMMNGETYVSLEQLAKALGYQVTIDATGKIINLEKEVLAEGVTEEQENNDTYLTANKIKLNASLKGNIGAKDEKNKKDVYDWYSIDIPSDGKLTLEFIGAPGLGVEVYIHDITGTKSIEWKGVKDTKGIIEKGLQKGTYFIRVRNTASSGDYTLTNSFVANTDANDKEENDTFQVAQSYQLGETAYGHLGYMSNLNKYDTSDWYKMTLTKKTKVNLTLQGTANLDFAFQLYKSNASSSIRYREGKNRVLNIEEELEAGTYYIVIRRRLGTASGSYTLSSK